MENNKTTIIIIGVDGQERKTVVDDFKDQAAAFLTGFTTQKETVQLAIAELSHEYVLYKNGGKNWKEAQKALKEAQETVAEMNRFLGLDFRQFKRAWKPYQVEPAYGIVCRAISHYWGKFYGTPEVDGILQYVTFYTEELKKIRYVERDED